MADTPQYRTATASSGSEDDAVGRDARPRVLEDAVEPSNRGLREAELLGKEGDWEPSSEPGCQDGPQSDVVASKGCSEDDDSRTERGELHRGRGSYGCSHYRRRCRLRMPCCNEVFDCRHCHNEAKNAVEIDSKERHDCPRHQVQFVICSLCQTEQLVAQDCSSCGVRMGEYFCGVCKFFDDETCKDQFHCEDCGICRVGGRANFFHCATCGCCYALSLRPYHKCVEKAMHHNCAVCFEYLFDSVRPTSVLKCGHTIHAACLEELERHGTFTCPICSKSFSDMSSRWRFLDQVVADTPMPEEYSSSRVWILCNDCSARSEVPFHVLGQKCDQCHSYNTRRSDRP